jgi:hypothetical protein
MKKIPPLYGVLYSLTKKIVIMLKQSLGQPNFVL